MRPDEPKADISRTGSPIGAIRRATSGPRETHSFFFILLLAYLFFEYGRPAQMLKLPMLISILSFGGWLVRRDKRWSPQTTLFMAFLGLMVVGIPMAANNYWAFWETYGMAVSLLCVCAPLPSLVTSVRRIKIWIYTFVAVAAYVGVWAIIHRGYGPSGADGGQDENYVAAMMGMAVSFAYFTMLTETRRAGKVLLALAIMVFCGAIVVAENASRGGVVALCSVILYCLVKSPRKWMALGVTALIALVVLGFAGPKFWDEMSTITHVHEGTADDRLELWTIGLRMFVAHPVFGIGPASFRWEVGAYQSSEQHLKYGRDLGGTKVTHSLFVELLSEMGLTGAVVLAALLWRTWSGLRQVQRSQIGRNTSTADNDLFQVRRYADAVMGSILACLVNGIFLSLLYFTYLWLLLALADAIMQVFRAQVAAKQPV